MDACAAGLLELEQRSKPEKADAVGRQEISDVASWLFTMAGAARRETRDVKHRATHSAQVPSLKDILAKAS